MTLRLFYGWWIVAAAVLLQFTFLSISQSTVGVFLRPVVEDMGWQIWQFTLGSSLAVMAGALSGVVVGRMVDQRGPRLPVLGGALVSAICLFGLGRQSSLWLFWALHLCAGFIGWTLFGPLVVDSLGWRNGYYVYALFVLVIVAPITLLMRRTPEDTGLRPDGETGRGSEAMR